MEIVRTIADYDRFYPSSAQFEWQERFEQVRHEGGQTLEQAAKATGRGAAISWLTRQLYKLPTSVIVDSAEWLDIAQRMYSKMKKRTLPQIMVFIFRVAGGEFGKIFGKPNTSELGQWWKAYDAALDSITIKDEPQEIDFSNSIKEEEYQQLKALAAIGDRAAQDGMFPPDEVLQRLSAPIIEAHLQRAREYGRNDIIDRIQKFIY